MLKEIKVSSQFFNATDTLECGQIFRYQKIDSGYLVLSQNRACIINTQGNFTTVTLNECDSDYFLNYFDLQTDYSDIYNKAVESKYPVLQKSATLGKGVRILRQNSEEMLFSFLVSQNNNIPRIKKILNELSEKLGEKQEFLGHEYYTFPTSQKISEQTEQFFKECGLGYRARYLKILSEEINNGLIERLSGADSETIKKELLKITGIGEKVADCVLLFGFYQTKSFPVDVWIEKIYREDFNGSLTNRSKITEFFINEFGYYAGYFQQYLFYYKRSLEKNLKKDSVA